MRKLLIYLVVLVLIGIAQAPQKPILGELLDASQFDMPDGLWLFNEGAGPKVYDLSGNGNDGVLTNNAVWAAGNFGPAIAFDGTGDYVQLADKIVFTAGENWTILFWANQTSGAGVHGMICGEQGTADNYFWFYEGNYLRYRNDSSQHIQWAQLTDFTGWHQYAILGVNDGTYKSTLYKDGKFVAGDNVVTTSMEVDVIGAGYSGESSDLNGKIGLFMIFNYALTASQIAHLYQDPFPWFAEDVLDLYVPAAPAGGQVIFFIYSSMGYGFSGVGLILAWALIQRIKNRKFTRR